MRVSANHHPYRRVAVAITLISFSLAQLPQEVMAQDRPAASPVTIEQCRDLSDPAVRSQLKALTEAALAKEMGQLNYGELVDKYWREVKMDERLDREIDEAIRIERASTNVLNRAYSTISKETAEKTAIAVAERAYGSEGFKSALGDLAQGVGKEFGSRIEKSSERISGPVISCVRQALQSRYGTAVADVFTRETQENLDIKSQVGATKIESTDLLLQNVGTISGIVLIVSRRIIARMVASIGRRIAGLVASRIISSFTGLIGLALIARDIYEASEGVFPLIAERMKSSEAKDLIKQELTKSIETDLNQQVGAIAEETTERIYAFWQDFKAKYNLLLGLAEKSTDFAQFLRERTVNELGRLGRIVSLLVDQEGEDGALKRTKDGTLRRALLDLDETGVGLALEIKSLDRALAWAKLAGQRLPKAIQYGLPQHIQPDQITASQLNTLLSFDNRAAALRVAQLDKPARDALLGLPLDTLRMLAQRLSERELAALASYQERLSQTAAARLLREVGADPSLMKTLSKRSIQDAIAESRDQLSAVTMLLRDNAALNVSNITDDFALVREGDVNYWIFVERYWAGILVLVLLGLLMLAALRRLIFGRTPTVIIKTADSGGNK
jgi:hypothetical protein